MAEAQQGFLEAAGERLEWARWGDPAKPSLVFLHEGLGCVALWRDFPERVAEATGWSAFAYSRSGYGQSQACELPRPTSYMHREAQQVLPAVLTAAEISDYIHVGHSDGGSIALIHAASRPGGRLRGLITEAAHVFNEDVCVRTIEEIDERYRQGDLEQRLRKYHGANTECAFRGWCDAWLHPEFRFWNLEEFLPRIRVPWLVIQGRDDDYGTLAQVDAIVAGTAGPSQTFLPDGCGHFPHIDRPEALCERMAQFVAELD